MERSLNRTSRSSLGVNLPIEWTKKFSLKPRDKVKIIEKGNRLVLSTNLSAEKEITLDLTEGNISSIRQSIYESYIGGYDIIHLKYQPTTQDLWSDGIKILSTKELIQKTVENLMLLECMELTDEKATLQVMESEYNIREFKKMLSLTFVLLKNFSQEINKELHKKKCKNNFSFLESQHRNLRRYIRYSNRYLAKVGLGEKTLSYKDLFEKLERLTICLKFMYTMHKELPIKMRFGSEGLNLFNDIVCLLTDSLENFNNYDSKNAASLYERRRELTLRAYQLAKSDYKPEMVISQRWVEILSKIVFIINHSAPITCEKPKSM